MSKKLIGKKGFLKVTPGVIDPHITYVILGYGKMGTIKVYAVAELNEAKGMHIYNINEKEEIWDLLSNSSTYKNYTTITRDKFFHLYNQDNFSNLSQCIAENLEIYNFKHFTLNILDEKYI